MKTDQEKFWSTDFGNKYTKRTHEKRKYFTTRIKMWSDILLHTSDIKSVFEIGSNTGINMDVINFLMNKKELLLKQPTFTYLKNRKFLVSRS